MLTDDEFWELVATLGARPDAQDDTPYEELTEKLAQGPVDRITGFAEVLARQLYELDRRYLAQGTGLSDDGFLYARCAVVVAGREVVATVLADKAAFAPYATDEAAHAESILDVASNAYRLKTGREWDHIEKFDYETGSNEKWW
ncbi:DUF4240 domain-containing protein [Catellatospora chokoriensis]|uniref:DUF4240 domain-containing protein n=1 Tax=Catellatospora chokoriensis TaxID=310353 RepID=A0A8J3K6Z2_9ACTN|nr:DUF4240 domain-containing protein [Catellatospora chokoriensis]GIF91398.1 hypothetical protein Cch02nite_48420 [Catellatospora chokoriensis]